MPPYGEAMVVRGFFALLTGLAMALAPLGMPAMAEAAAPAAPHHQMMAGSGHCDQPQPQPDKHPKVADKNCCAAMCLAVVMPSGAPESVSYRLSSRRPGSDVERHGFLGEIATPPPKLS